MTIPGAQREWLADAASGDWRERWRRAGQPWRTEPPIDDDRRRFLSAWRAVAPDIQRGIYPFKDVQLGQANVEWLLAEQGGDAGADGGEGLVRLGGLDVRGADLRRTDLNDLPLSGLIAGLAIAEWPAARDEQRDLAAAHLEGAILQRAHLEGADLQGANVREADLGRASLHGAILRGARLEGARLVSAHLGGKEVPLYDMQRIRRWQQEFPQHLPPADLRGAVFDANSDLLGIDLGDAEHGWVEVADVRWGDAILTVVA